MPAPKGHPLWGNPLNHKTYTPEEIWDKFCEYTDWNDEHPIGAFEQKRGNTQLKIEAGIDISDIKDNLKDAVNPIVEIPVIRPYSLERFCSFADISYQTFLNYSNKEGYETYFEVCSRIRQVIDGQHFEYGMTNIFNANIVTRKLGLAEKSEIATDLTFNVTLKKKDADS